MAEFDQYKETYAAQIDRAAKFSGKDHDFFVRAKAAYLIDVLKTKIETGTDIRLLDVGCGHGLIHPLLEASGLPLQVTGIDVAAEVIDLARRVNPKVRYDIYEGDALPYESGSFDAAVTITVVHHVPPPRWSDFLSEMTRVVRPGGIAAVFEHNPFNPVTAYVVRTCPVDKNAVLLPSWRLVRLMRAIGLEEVETRFILFTPFESPFFIWVDRSIGWLPFGAQYYVTGRVPEARG